MYGQLTLLVVAVSITSPTVIAVAGIIVAIVVVIGGVLVFRSGKNKGGNVPGAGSAAQTDWQRQSQQSASGGWNPQGNMGNMGGMSNDAPAWAQQNQAMGQNGWNSQSMAQQAQPGGWGMGQDVQSQPPSWAAQVNQPQQAQQPSWMQNAQQSSSPSWAAQGQMGQQGLQATPAPNGWGNQGFQAAQGQGQDSWSTQGQGTQQPATTFGGGNASASPWNPASLSGAQGQNTQSNSNDGWSAGGTQQSQYASQQQNAGNAMGGFSAPTNNGSQAPSWTQGGFGQSNAGQGNMGQGGMMGGNAGNASTAFGGQGQQSPSFADNTMLGSDVDRTILRTAGTGLGVVRVEAGKEPGREYEIRKESLSIGRSRESDIFLEDLAVSRLHASIVNQGNGNYALKDEGSANGTKVNGQLVGKYQTYPLQDGDQIQLGQTVLVFGHR